MSWKSQQGYAVGEIVNAPTLASQANDSGDVKEIYVSPELPTGVWLIIVNEVAIPIGDLTSAVLAVYQNGNVNPIASINLSSDIVQFPSLVVAVRSNGAVAFTIDLSAETSAGTWDADAGRVQIVRLTTH